MTYLVAAIGDWNKFIFEKNVIGLQGTWHYVSSPEELKQKLAGGLEPRYIFFQHWSWIVPEEILIKSECVCFHMTDVPYGRGGSPLQNLIVRGHKETILTALQMEKGIDTGPVYFKKPLTLQGAAKDIYVRATELTWEMIKQIVELEPKPKAQVGEPVVFKRRTPEQSEIESGLSIEQVYDYIRMLDAPGYPKAFLDSKTYHLEFEDAKLEDDELIATVRIKFKR
jgi:methionyl-tRNA formyltransferase